MDVNLIQVVETPTLFSMKPEQLIQNVMKVAKALGGKDASPEELFNLFNALWIGLMAGSQAPGTIRDVVQTLLDNGFDGELLLRVQKWSDLLYDGYSTLDNEEEV